MRTDPIQSLVDDTVARNAAKAVKLTMERNRQRDEAGLTRVYIWITFKYDTRDNDCCAAVGKRLEILGPFAINKITPAFQSKAEAEVKARICDT